MIKVLSVGGSIVAPAEPDTAFLTAFAAMIRSWLNEDTQRRLILVVGGGAPARLYQNSYRSVCSLSSAGSGEHSLIQYDNNEADWLGIMATRLNAQLLKAVFSDLCADPVVCNPTADFNFTGRILVAAGWTRTPCIWPTASEQKRLSIFQTSKKYTAQTPKSIPMPNPWTIFCGRTFCTWSAKNGCPAKIVPSIRLRAKKPTKRASRSYARAEKISTICLRF